MTTTKEEIIEYLRSHKQDFRTKLDIVKIGIFGSYAAGIPKEESDIDVIVESAEETDNLFDKKYELREQIKRRFNIEVNICRESAIKEIFREDILREAIFV